MLGVARHARIGQPGRARGRERDLDGVAETPEPRVTQTRLHRREQLTDPRLRRVGPLRLRDQVDLAPVQPPRDHRRGDTAAPKLGDGIRCSRVERRLLRRCRLPAFDELEAVRARRVDLGAAVDTEVEPPRARRPGAQLPVDVADVRAGDDDQVEPERAQLFDQRPQLARVGTPVGNGCAIPVEDHGLEPTVQ